MSASSKVRVGIILPESHYGEAEWQNAERAIAFADEAAGGGAQLVLFPEGYPGPMTGPLDNPKFPFDPIEELKKKAKQHSIYIIAGNVTDSDVAGAYLLTLAAIEANALVPAWGTTTTPAPQGLSSSADACRVLGQLTGLSGAIDDAQSLRMNPIDLMPYRQLFLHSHIGACSSQGPRGENTIVRHVVITGSPGDLIADFHHTTSDYIELGGQLSTLHFSLRDVGGRVVDTRGHPVSFSLCLTEGM